jgi:hypothetical protein
MQLLRYDRNNFFPYLTWSLGQHKHSAPSGQLFQSDVSYQNNDMKERQNKRRDNIKKGMSENLNLAESLLLEVIG